MRSGLAVFGAGLALVVVPSAGAASSDYRAFVDAPPKVQVAGRTYLLKIDVRNLGGSAKPFCVDFDDDHNSWLIEMPGLSSWANDAFCVGTLRAHAHKVLRAMLTPAKPGAHTLKVYLGKAKVYRSIRHIVVDDDDGLYWSRQFVIVG